MFHHGGDARKPPTPCRLEIFQSARAIPGSAPIGEVPKCRRGDVWSSAVLRLAEDAPAFFWGETDMPRDPASEWQERYAYYGTELAFKPETNTRIFSSVQPICVSPRVVRTSLSAGLVFRDRGMVRDGNDNINFAVSFEHDLNLSQHGREICLRRNQATIMQADAPGTAGTRRQFKVLEISVPQQEWRLRGPHPHEGFMKVVDRHSECLKLLLGYVGVLAKTGLPNASETCDSVSRHLIDLTVLAATRPSVGESRTSCVVAARRAAALDHIASHFQDPDLTGVGLARSLGISQRYLQRLLQESGKSLTEHVNELRLNRAFALLTAADSTRRVSDIAFEVGFSDLAHFYRMFRTRFGDTPKGVLGSMRTTDAGRT
jgi:AraC-like DNA-binding protein